jgi:hypothetical protein
MSNPKAIIIIIYMVKGVIMGSRPFTGLLSSERGLRSNGTVIEGFR